MGSLERKEYDTFLRVRLGKPKLCVTGLSTWWLFCILAGSVLWNLCDRLQHGFEFFFLCLTCAHFLLVLPLVGFMHSILRNLMGIPFPTHVKSVLQTTFLVLTLMVVL